MLRQAAGTARALDRLREELKAALAVHIPMSHPCHGDLFGLRNALDKLARLLREEGVTP